MYEGYTIMSISASIMALSLSVFMSAVHLDMIARVAPFMPKHKQHFETMCILCAAVVCNVLMGFYPGGIITTNAYETVLVLGLAGCIGIITLSSVSLFVTVIRHKWFPYGDAF